MSREIRNHCKHIFDIFVSEVDTDRLKRYSRNIFVDVDAYADWKPLQNKLVHSVSVLLFIWCSDYQLNKDTGYDGEFIEFATQIKIQDCSSARTHPECMLDVV